MSARALAAPLHRHTREDEYSYVLEGRMGALLGDDVLEAGPGDLGSSPATSGTRSGTPGMTRAGSSRSSHRPASRVSLPSWSTLAASRRRTPRPSANSASATRSRWTHPASPALSSASACTFPRSPSSAEDYFGRRVVVIGRVGRPSRPPGLAQRVRRARVELPRLSLTGYREDPPRSGYALELVLAAVGRTLARIRPRGRARYWRRAPPRGARGR